ncbi:hypothetical protein U0070_021722, partial [Myodes glareolus]
SVELVRNLAFLFPSQQLQCIKSLSDVAPVHPGTAVYTAKETHKDMQIPAAGTQTQKNTPDGQRSAEPWVDKQRAPNLGGAEKNNPKAIHLKIVTSHLRSGLNYKTIRVTNSDTGN